MPDGTHSDYSANVLIENIMVNVDDNGQTAVLLNEITGHQPNCSNESDEWYNTPQGLRKRRITTRGYDLNMLWADGTS